MQELLPFEGGLPGKARRSKPRRGRPPVASQPVIVIQPPPANEFVVDLRIVSRWTGSLWGHLWGFAFAHHRLVWWLAVSLMSSTLFASDVPDTSDLENGWEIQVIPDR